MNLNPRQSAIVEAVQAEGPQSLETLSARFGVSVQTLRRDVTLLAESGLLARFHGGVRQPAPVLENLAYTQRERLNARAKQCIADTVAKCVPDGSSLMLGVGTTMEAIARHLLRHKRLRVITASLNVAAILADNRECEVLVACGQLRHADRALVGEAAVDFIRQFKVDIGLLGISGIEHDGTLRDFDFHEVRMARAIMQQSREVWVATDLSKLERPAMVAVGHLGEIDRLFVDAPLPAAFVTLLDETGVAYVVANGCDRGEASAEQAEKLQSDQHQ